MDVAAFAYGLVASFVVAALARNRRDARAHPAILSHVAWLLLSFSGASAVILLGYAGWKTFGHLIA